jgi:hypothetical protein
MLFRKHELKYNAAILVTIRHEFSKKKKNNINNIHIFYLYPYNLALKLIFSSKSYKLNKY